MTRNPSEHGDDGALGKYMLTPDQTNNVGALSACPAAAIRSRRSSWVKSTATNSTCSGMAPNARRSSRLLCLAGGMVDLQHANLARPVGVAIRDRVKTGAEHYDLVETGAKLGSRISSIALHRARL